MNFPVATVARQSAFSQTNRGLIQAHATKPAAGQQMESPAWCSFRMPMICPSVNLDHFIVCLLR